MRLFDLLYKFTPDFTVYLHDDDGTTLSCPLETLRKCNLFELLDKKVYDWDVQGMILYIYL